MDHHLHSASPLKNYHHATPQLRLPETLPSYSSFPIDIIPIIAKYLRCDGASATLAALQSLCRRTYYLLTPILFSRIRITEHSWNKLFGLFEGIPLAKIDPPHGSIEEVVRRRPQLLGLPAYIRIRWLFSLIKHLELVALGSLRFTNAASAIGKSLSEKHSEFLLSGLQTMHITEVYTARSFGPPDDDGSHYCHYTDQEAVLAPLCAPHRMCIHVPKDDHYAELITPKELATPSDVERALKAGVRSMLGGVRPQQVNATAVTYHNVNRRFIIPPYTEGPCQYAFCFIPHDTVLTNVDCQNITMDHRAQQIAESIWQLPHLDPQELAILRPLSKVSSDSEHQLYLVRERVWGILEELYDEAHKDENEENIEPDDALWIFDPKINYLCGAFHESDWQLESEIRKSWFGEDGICDVCDGGCWRAPAYGS